MAKKRAKTAKRTKKKGLNLGVLRRAAKSRVKRLQANIKKRNKAIARAKKRGDLESINKHRKLQMNAKAMIGDLKGIIRAMSDDGCPFAHQGDPLAN